MLRQVRGVAAVGPGDNVAARSRRPFGPPVAGGATVGQAGPDDDVGLDAGFAVAVTGDRPLPLIQREFPLEELPSPTDGAERITRNNKPGTVGGHSIASSGANLLSE